MSQRVVTCADAEALATTVAQRLRDALVELMGEQDVVRLCLTGGTIANRTYAALAKLLPDPRLDVDRLEVYWGDERFVASADEDRNARQALLHLGGSLLGATIHPIPGSDQAASAEDAAGAYAEILPREFHLELLGIGPDGHCLSVFPGHPSFDRAKGSDASPASVIAVHDSPKPPSTRVSLTIPAACRARRVWILASGAEKADAVARAMRGDATLPAAHVGGTESTTWFLDEAAASAR